jgi:magnesium chelatase family protein
MLAQTVSASVIGVNGEAVRVEVDVAFGLPGLTIVGLAGSAVLEARERVRSALRNSGFELPARRITINLAPADLPKEGTGYDLAMAIGILAASGQLDAARLAEVALIGEVALDGGLRPVPGAMALVTAARDGGLASAIVPIANVDEAATVRGIAVHPAASLGDAVGHLAGVRRLRVAEPPVLPPVVAVDAPDLAHVVGQRVARRALEIAIAGRHNLALIGPPGIGKTLLLRASARLLPPLDDDEAAEVSRIYSVAGLLDRRAPLVRTRPFRSPHHTISTQALVGGGPRVRPGEASLAHRGVLMLDETLQFRADALEALRQPLESGSVTIARVEGALQLPARFSLLTAYNPCPCGWSGVADRTCTCEEGQRRRYLARLSGPVRDRIDLHVLMDATLHGNGMTGENSTAVAERVAVAFASQRLRQGCSNAELAPEAIGPATGFSPRVLRELERATRRLGLSPRRLHRAARVARTIADLGGVEPVTVEHVAEALQYRPVEAAP